MLELAFSSVPWAIFSLSSLTLSFACTLHLLAHVSASMRARGVSVAAMLGCVGAAGLLFCGAAPIAAGVFCWSAMARGATGVAGACSIWFCLSVLSLDVYAARHRADPTARVGFIIVPGAALRQDRPSPILAARLDRALELWLASKSRASFVVSGGQGADECVSEAAVMRNYLLARGVPDELIWIEDRSTTTRENMRFSLETLHNHGVRACESDGADDSTVAIVSTDYHLLRCMFYARRYGMRAAGVGASSAGRRWSRGYLREVAALTKMLLPTYILPVATGCVLVLAQ